MRAPLFKSKPGGETPSDRLSTSGLTHVLPFPFITMASPRPSTCSGKRALPGGKVPVTKRISLEGEKVEETAVYTISANHGQTARVSYWNGRALLQLRAVKQDAQGDSRRILVTLDAGEVSELSEHIERAREILAENPDRNLAGPSRLFFRCLSTSDSGRHRYIEVSRWQGLVRASVRRLFVNDQGHLCPTKDGITLTLPHLVLLQRLLPLIRRDFVVADRIANQLNEREEETLAQILAVEAEMTAAAAAGTSVTSATVAPAMGPPTKAPKKAKKKTTKSLPSATVLPAARPRSDLVERAAAAAELVVDLTRQSSTETEPPSSDDDRNALVHEEYSQWQPDN